ncbi:hypothetical protein ACIBHX_27785 [Nonomuraea sp. NPDC050536]|uniref:hypothetical protein n=1 Tax=Nonomuraea sp. NPDC050536 TaxID=3364366 RepID=UPI0037C9F856
MKIKTGRRVASALGGAALALGITLGTAGTANAWTADWETVDDGHGVGIYNGPSSTSGKHGFHDLYTPDEVYLICWIRGEDIANQGNVWYRTSEVYYYRIGSYNLWGNYYVYGAYVDNYYAFHHRLDECKS